MNIHTKCLQLAAKKLNFPITSIGQSGVFIAITIGKKPYYFIANGMPLNNVATTTVTEDKGHTYDLLHPVISIPKTLQFIDPNAPQRYQPFVTHSSLESIAKKITQKLALPCIIKKNSGSQGEHVYKCDNSESVITSLESIYNQQSTQYDHVAIAQEYIEISQEYRVTVLDRQVELLYLKDNSQASFAGNLSPLHWHGATAQLLTDATLTKQINDFINPIFSVLDLKYGGLDIAIDTQGKWWLIEINSRPAYDHLVQQAGETVLINLYLKILSYLKTTSS